MYKNRERQFVQDLEVVGRSNEGLVVKVAEKEKHIKKIERLLHGERMVKARLRVEKDTADDLVRDVNLLHGEFTKEFKAVEVNSKP